MTSNKPSIKHRIKESITKIKYKLYFEIFNPTNLVIIYQMGKVGSATVRDSLEKYDIKPVFHVHRMNPEYIKEVKKEHIKKGSEPNLEVGGRLLYKYIIKIRKKAKLITLVRGPISRNISAFFENYDDVTGNTLINQNYKINDLTGFIPK